MPARMVWQARFVLHILVLAGLLALAGCGHKGIEVLVSEQLFSLNLGRLDNQIDLFRPGEEAREGENHMVMRDGWFYVANGPAKKVMVFSSYGDLIFLLYNPQTNPTPTLLGSAATGSDEASTRGSVAYPFNDLGQIAVASDKTLYVEDSVPDAKAVQDNERGVLQSRVILRFDRKGKPLGYIGQEGPGGTPFAYIYGMYVTNRDELVVISRLPASWETFWYSREGKLLYRREIDQNSLPVQASNNLVPTLVNVLPDVEKPILYLCINLYRADPDSANPSGQDTVVARAYRLDMESGRFGSYVEFPQNPPTRQREGLQTTVIPSPPSDLMGVSSDGSLFLLAYTDANLYTLQILNSSGRLIASRRMVIEDSELTYREVHLSSTGILYGLLADRTKARISWWRSDQLASGE